MAEQSDYHHGVFNWIDLCTVDTGAAKAFYSELFGLSFVDETHPDGTVYTLGLKHDQPVVGMMAQPADLKKMGIPSQWETYVKVDDIDAAAARVTEAGGTRLGDVTDVSDSGRLAVIADPTGAVLILWEPISHLGAAYVNEHGTMCWNELNTQDPEAAMAFYSALLGWTGVPMDGSDRVGIRHRGEFIGTVASAPPDLPAHWSVYFAVDDCDAVAEHCGKLGGSVIFGPTDLAPGRTALLADGQGAGFWVIALDENFSMSPA